MIFLSLLLLAIIPAMIAAKKGRSAGLWWIYGVLLFPIAVVHALLADNQLRYPCPHCAEPIQRKAVICPHCRSALTPGATQEHPQGVTATRGGSVFLVIALLLALVAIIGGASSGVREEQHTPKAQTVDEQPSTKPDAEEERKAAWHAAHPDPGAVSLCRPPHKMTARDGCQ